MRRPAGVCSYRRDLAGLTGWIWVKSVSNGYFVTDFGAFAMRELSTKDPAGCQVLEKENGQRLVSFVNGRPMRAAKAEDKFAALSMAYVVEKEYRPGAAYKIQDINVEYLRMTIVTTGGLFFHHYADHHTVQLLKDLSAALGIGQPSWKIVNRRVVRSVSEEEAGKIKRFFIRQWPAICLRSGAFVQDGWTRAKFRLVSRSELNAFLANRDRR